MPNPSTKPGSYAGSAPQHGQAPSSNRTAQYLAAINAEHPGQQGFYRAALTGIPHPLQAGQTLNYGQLQDLLAGPQGATARDAYAVQNRLDRAPTAEQLLATRFEQARAAMLQRGAQNPGQLAFGPEADDALQAPGRAAAVAHGNYVPLIGGQLSNPLSAAQRYADLPAASAYTAPGMSVAAPMPAAGQTLTNVLRAAMATR